MKKSCVSVVLYVGLGLAPVLVPSASGQLVDYNKAPNAEREGIKKSYVDQVGPGRGDVMTPLSSSYVIARDPFRAIRRGRQLFQRKFTRAEGQGPVAGDGAGDIHTTLAIGAGLADGCASCHGRPRGSAGFGGDVVTRPDSRDAPHLFGLGLKEMLADEITGELRRIRDEAKAEAARTRRSVARTLRSKGIGYGRITARPDGTVDTSRVEGVDADLRVRPFFHHGGTISIREFVAGAFNAEMGLQSVDPQLAAAAGGGQYVTPAGMVLDGSKDKIEAPPAHGVADDPDQDGKVNEIPTSIQDFMEFYLLNYFKAGLGKQDEATARGREVFLQAGCNTCHIPDLVIDRDRRVADVETVYDPAQQGFNHLFATAKPLFTAMDDGSGHPTLKKPALGRFVVKNIFTDFKRHDLGPSFHERNYDGTLRTHFLTTPLWGVGSTPSYGHDGRSIDLREVILRHGGEARAQRDRFAALGLVDQIALTQFLNSLILFPPDDTASNLDPGDPANSSYPQRGHGSIRLGALFNDPTDPE